MNGETPDFLKILRGTLAEKGSANDRTE